ncbi:MAG: Na-K-Cl cotransporter [Oligoflexia bacterium]|nr:Na-K-Cl cotransporter [Oligoflexia bacterium]
MPSGDPGTGQTVERFGTYNGVFRPVFLTILGAMLYLREGWMVGDAGVLGALLIILAAGAITGTTTLSLATIASNVRVRPGGAFAIIAQALGLEAGGAIGIPLFIAQAASVAMYIFAFSEAWAYIFPTHPQVLVAGVAFAGIALLAWRSAGLAFRAQAVMMVVVVVALLSALGGLFTADQLHVPVLFGHLPQANLLDAFAIFFPAATGIMVGAGMSGSLSDPRRSIPRGTLWAWGTTLLVYAGFTLFYGAIGSPDELIADKTIMVNRAAVPALVLAGLLSSTLMAALSSLVAAPRLLQAMASCGVMPAGAWLGRLTPKGEPRNAVLATTGLAALGLAAGSLDAIAPLITSFFVMTFLAINGVVYLEQVLGMISFRPAFRIPTLVPLVGVGLCLAGLSLSSPFGGVPELALVVGIYVLLSRRHLDTPWETVRSGVAVTLAAWAARRAEHMERTERAWKPDLLVPVATVPQVQDLRPLVEALTRRNGSIRWVALGQHSELAAALPALVDRQYGQGLSATWTHLQTHAYMDGVGLALDALGGSLFPPNLVLVDVPRVSDDDIGAYIAHCQRCAIGLALWLPHPKGSLGPRKQISVWLSDRSPDWKLELHVANLDLPVLVGFLLADAWGASLRLVMALQDPTQVIEAREFLCDLVDQARLPSSTEIYVGDQGFQAALRLSPKADLHIFGIGLTVSKDRLAEVSTACGGSTLWLLDSGGESALA